MSPQGSPGQTPRLRPGERGPHRSTLRGRRPLASPSRQRGKLAASPLCPPPRPYPWPGAGHTDGCGSASPGAQGAAAGAALSRSLVCAPQSLRRARQSWGASFPPTRFAHTRPLAVTGVPPHAHTVSCLRAQGSATGRGPLRGSSGPSPSRAPPSLLLFPDPQADPIWKLVPECGGSRMAAFAWGSPRPRVPLLGVGRAPVTPTPPAMCSDYVKREGCGSLPRRVFPRRDRTPGVPCLHWGGQYGLLTSFRTEDLCVPVSVGSAQVGTGCCAAQTPPPPCGPGVTLVSAELVSYRGHGQTLTRQARQAPPFGRTASSWPRCVLDTQGKAPSHQLRGPEVEPQPRGPLGTRVCGVPAGSG